MDVDKELEQKTQELYSATSKVQLLTANVAHLEEEVQLLQADLQEKTSQLEHVQNSETRSKQEDMYRQMVSDLREEVDSYVALEKSHKEERESLLKRLDLALAEVAAHVAASNTSCSNFEAEELVQLKEELLEKEEQMIKLESQLLVAKSTAESQASQLSSIKEELAEKDEEIECLQGQFDTQCSFTQQLREENQQLKSQLEDGSVDVDDNRKGNSLFSEVEDRRILAEKKLVQTRQTMKGLEEKLTREMKENRRHKSQIALLRQSAKRSCDEGELKDLQQQLLQRDKSIVELNERVAQLEAGAKHHSKVVSRQPDSDDKSHTAYLERLVLAKAKEADSARTLSRSHQLQCVRTQLELTEATGELRAAKFELSELKLQNSHLAMNLQDLKHKYEESSENESPEVRRPAKHDTDAQGNTKTSSSPLVNILAPRSGDNIPKSQSAPDVKKDIRLRDLFDRSPSKVKGDKGSKGVQLGSEVKVLGAEGEETTAALKQEDGKGGKLRKVRGGKMKVSNTKVDVQPAECNQQ